MLNIDDAYMYLINCLKCDFSVDDKFFEFFESLEPEEQSELIYEKLLPQVRKIGKLSKLKNLFPEFLNENFEISISNPENYEITILNGINIGKAIVDDLISLKENKEIFIITPFIGGKNITRIMEELLKKEIKINIFTTCNLENEDNKHFLKFFINNKVPSTTRYWLKHINGENIFEKRLLNLCISTDNTFKNNRIHHKIYIINNILYIGSVNFTDSGLFQNFETLTRIKLKNSLDKQNVIEKYKRGFQIYTKIYEHYTTLNSVDVNELGKIVYES